MYNVWENALAEIEQQISSDNFSTWFQDTALISTEDGHIIIGVKNSFFTKQLRTKFLDVITSALKKNSVNVVDVDFQVQNSKTKIRPREVIPEAISINEHIHSFK